MSEITGNNFIEVDYGFQNIAIVKINRPEAKNALNTEVRKQLAQVFTELSFDDQIHAIVLTGGDEVFAAGADLKEMATATSTEMLLRHTERYWNAIAQCPKPVIAAVAIFGQPEIKLVGLMPGAGGTQRLFRAVGKFHAMRMIMTGAMVKAEEAYIIGLVSQVTEDDQTIPTAIQMAQSLAKMPPIALQQIKEVALMSEDVPLNAGLCLERKSFQLLFSTEDKNEGIQAFIEKRKPSYQGK
ncbi:hypothetical protein FQR65_LT19784 [Abscondita terminalis]|nr:hypothetical protein FQR65_LT19784 [Abscondita terminalis]